METYADIRKLLAASFGSPRQTLLGTVLEVDAAGRTCTVDDDGAVYYNVRLQCVTGGDTGLLLVPAAGASVLAVRVENSEEWMVIGCDRLESARIDVGGSSMEVTSGGIAFNGGTLGLVKIDALVSWMGQVHADLQKLTTLLSISAVAGNGAPLGIAFTPSTPEPVRANFEDTAVKH